MLNLILKQNKKIKDFKKCNSYFLFYISGYDYFLKLYSNTNINNNTFLLKKRFLGSTSADVSLVNDPNQQPRQLYSFNPFPVGRRPFAEVSNSLLQQRDRSRRIIVNAQQGRNYELQTRETARGDLLKGGISILTYAFPRLQPIAGVAGLVPSGFLYTISLSFINCLSRFTQRSSAAIVGQLNHSYNLLGWSGASPAAIDMAGEENNEQPNLIDSTIAEVTNNNQNNNEIINSLNSVIETSPRDNRFFSTEDLAPVIDHFHRESDLNTHEHFLEASRLSAEALGGPVSDIFNTGVGILGFGISAITATIGQSVFGMNSGGDPLGIDINNMTYIANEYFGGEIPFQGVLFGIVFISTGYIGFISFKKIYDKYSLSQIWQNNLKLTHDQNELELKKYKLVNQHLYDLAVAQQEKINQLSDHAEILQKTSEIL